MTDHGEPRRRPAVRLGAALGGRRRVRIGSIQAAYVLGAVGLGLVVPHIPVGFTVESSRVTEMLIAVGAASVLFLGITYSLLLCSSARHVYAESQHRECRLLSAGPAARRRPAH